MNDKKKLAKNIASVGLIQIANYVFPMISIPIISRIIGPDKLGTINFAASFISYFVLLIGYGFDLTATRRVSKDPDNLTLRSAVFSEVLTSQIILLSISSILFIIAVLFIPQLRVERNVAIFSFLICFSTVITQNWLFQAMQDLSKVAVLNLVSKVVFTILVIWLVQKKSDYYWQPFALSVSQIAVSVISFTWAIKRYKLHILRIPLINCFRLIWDEKVFFLSLCIINIYTSTNIVILGFMTNVTQVGFYTAGQKLIGILQMIINVPLAQALFPFIGTAFGESFERGVSVSQKLFPLIFGFTFCAGVVVFFGSPIFIQLFYGNAFRPAVNVCKILAFVPMLISLETLMGIHVMLNLKMDKQFFQVTCVGAVVSILFNLFLTRIIGYKGSAVTWLATEMVNFILFFILLRRRGISIINFKYFNFKYNIQLVKTYKLKLKNR
jgi:O-antigen/teichoic acid export membrane protein